MKQVIRKINAKIYSVLSRHLYKTGDDFRLAEAIEPLVTNNAIKSYLIPLTLVSIGLSVFVPNNNSVALVLIIVWYLVIFFLMLGLTMKWFIRSKVAASRNQKILISRMKIAKTLADYHRKNPEYFEVLNWDENIVISGNGKVTIDRLSTIEPTSDRLVDFFWSTLQSYGPPVAQQDVTIRATLVIEGNEEVPLEFDEIWNEAKQVSEVHVYLARSYASGSTARIRIIWEWPGYYSNLVKGSKPEPFEYTISRKCHSFKMNIKLPPGRDYQWEFLPGSQHKNENYEKKINGNRTSFSITTDGCDPGKVLRGRLLLVNRRVKKK